MEFYEAKLVLDSLASHGKTGCGIITLANQTNISQSILREFLNSNKDFFCQLNGESKYTINSFGRYKGSIDKMTIALSKQYKEANLNQYAVLVILAFFLGYVLGGI
jgi:hypothetical protein